MKRPMTPSAVVPIETLVPRDVLAQQPRVGDVVRVTFQASAIRYIYYRVTGIDEQGIHGIWVRNTVREITLGEIKGYSYHVPQGCCFENA